MNINKLALGLALAFFISLNSFSTPLSIEQKHADLEQLAWTIKSQYGPKEYKKHKLNIDVDALLAKYKRQAVKTTNGEFYYLINQFVGEFKDAHFGASRNTSFISYLGFRTDLVEGNIVIESIDRSVLKEEAFPFKRGDRVVSLNGVSAKDVAADLSNFVGLSNYLTAKRYSAMAVSTRAASRFFPEKGEVEVSILAQGAEEAETVTLTWLHKGTLHEEGSNRTIRPTNYQNISIEPFNIVEKSESDFRCSGSTRTKVPEGATVLMMTPKDPFVAYYHATDKGNVGYLRIPHYYWGEDTELRMAQYKWALSKLEANTVGLIIDQDHNCGGYVSTVEEMVGFFMDKPYPGLAFQFLGSRKEYLEFSSYITSAMEKTIEAEQWKRVLALIKTSWGKGDWMTPKTDFHGGDLLAPSQVQYTKPILMLIDEMSGSGGDAFPSTMKGLGRAKLMGKQTMGAGGHVAEIPALNFSASKVRMTKSLFFKPNGDPVENNGAIPDYDYTPTLSDFTNQYQDYQKAYIAKLLEMVD